jgi:uridine kinase
MRDNQAIMLLHGAGGSGKTAVLDLVSEMLKEYFF